MSEGKSKFKLGLAGGVKGPGWDSLKQLTDEELRNEYNGRIPVLNQMCGNMYQSILCDELNLLQSEVIRRGMKIKADKTI